MERQRSPYIAMENILQHINANYISLPEEEIKRNNIILKEIVETILIEKMKAKDPLFKKLYTRIYYGGSYYDKLKVGRPEEYDLDLLMTLPKQASPVLSCSNQPGFMYIQLPEVEKLYVEGTTYKGIKNLVDDKNFLLNNQVRSWIESLLQKVLNDLDKSEGFSLFALPSAPGSVFKGKICKSGPAATLKLKGRYRGSPLIEMDVDLVPSFLFQQNSWPSVGGGYRSNPGTKSEFFVVPKGPTINISDSKYWRLSFPDQERMFLNGNKKPTIRLIKKLRDRQNDTPIASYYIKTIFMWDNGDWKEPLSESFMKGLKKYEEYLRNCEIPFFWNKRNNLLCRVSRQTCTDIANKVQNIRRDIDRNLDSDPYTVAKYLLSPPEVAALRQNPNGYLGARTVRKNEIADAPMHESTATNSVGVGTGMGTAVAIGVGVGALFALGRLLTNNNNNN